MGPERRRRREKEHLRRAILDAARELFVADGYSAVSMRRIAERIEYSPTALYLHFRDKDEILTELIVEGFQLLCDAMAPLEDVPDPVERLRAGGRRYLRFSREHPHHYRLMFELADDSALAATLEAKRDVGAKAFGFIVRCVAEGRAQGRFRTDLSETVLAHLVWAQVHGAAALALAHRLVMLEPEDRDGFGEMAADAAVRAILA